MAVAFYAMQRQILFGAGGLLDEHVDDASAQRSTAETGRADSVCDRDACGTDLPLHHARDLRRARGLLRAAPASARRLTRADRAAAVHRRALSAWQLPSPQFAPSGDGAAASLTSCVGSCARLSARPRGHDALRGADAAAAAFRQGAAPLQGRRRRCCSRATQPAPARRASRWPRRGPARSAPGGADGPDADGPLRPRLRLRRQLRDAARRARRAGRRQRLHLGRRVRVADQLRAARPPRRDDRPGDGRGGRRRAARAGRRRRLERARPLGRVQRDRGTVGRARPDHGPDRHRVSSSNRST